MNHGDTRRSELDIHPMLNARFSNRAFSEREVSDAELELVLEAARWAPSSMNEQPWRFLVTRRGGEGHGTLLAALNPSNQIWVDKAPVLILAMVLAGATALAFLVNGHDRRQEPSTDDTATPTPG